MLKQRLDDDELDLLEIVEDPILFGEFMRSTSDGEADKNLWPTTTWEYRDYQRQFLSDRTEYILYTGGRAIGKCQPSGAKIYTTEGYKTIREVRKQKNYVFGVYALNETTGELEQRRAVAVKDKLSPCYTIRTETGHEIVATPLHPILTPKGYVLVDALREGDYIAVMTHLPWESTRNHYRWHELRILGYILLDFPFNVEKKIMPRFKSIAKEFEVIAERLICNLRIDFDGYHSFKIKRGPFIHPLTSLLRQVSAFWALTINGVKHIPQEIMLERLENIKVFLEALYAQFGDLKRDKVILPLPHKLMALDLQELLLRFGIETRINTDNSLETLDNRAVYRFWNTFNLPGVNVGNLPKPPDIQDPFPFMRFEPIISRHLSHENTDTYAVHVYQHNNYITDNVFVHNSVVLEDKMIWDIVNSQVEFPVTPEMVLVTSNQAQMTPLQNRLILRFTASKFLKDFLRGNINKSTGVMTFPRPGKPFILTMRIAGSRGENNMVGLHIPKIIGDEAQLFPIPAFTQLGPAYNGWEPNRQQVWAGVPNGLRNSVLYLIDMQSPQYKKYRIPAPNNVMGYSYENYTQDLRKYGGEQDDRFQQLVLGRHGSAAFQVIPREIIQTEAYPLYNQRYNSGHVQKGKRYDTILELPTIPDNNRRILAVDTGFVDPTIIQLIGRDHKGKWRIYLRYRLTRIDFNEQEKIIDWIASHYNVDQLAIDIGAGGGGAGIVHHLINDPQYAHKHYDKRVVGIQFKENVVAGYDDEGEEMTQDAKGFAANELAKLIQNGLIIFSELDHEGISEVERIAKKRSMNGRDSYFVMSENGNGVDEDDHIFASFICFALAVREEPISNMMKRLAKPLGSLTANAPKTQ